MKDSRKTGRSMDSSRRLSAHEHSSSERSVSSSRILVPGTGSLPNRHHQRSHSRTRSFSSAFSQADQEIPPSKRKTKLIIVLGVTLPVIACVIGIVAWAVTTDVLRIAPRRGSSSVALFGQRSGNEVSDRFQDRSDPEIDVFSLTLPKTSSKPSRNVDDLSTEQVFSGDKTEILSTTKKPKEAASDTNLTPTLTSNMKASQVLASDILKKLVSDAAIKKKTAEFVVFAPVPDQSDMKKPGMKSARKMKDMVLISDDTDLVAEESTNSEEFSQEVAVVSSKHEKHRPLKTPPKRKAHRARITSHEKVTGVPGKGTGGISATEPDSQTAILSHVQKARAPEIQQGSVQKKAISPRNGNSEVKSETGFDWSGSNLKSKETTNFSSSQLSRFSNAAAAAHNTRNAFPNNFSNAPPHVPAGKVFPSNVEPPMPSVKVPPPRESQKQIRTFSSGAQQISYPSQGLEYQPQEPHRGRSSAYAGSQAVKSHTNEARLPEQSPLLRPAYTGQQTYQQDYHTSQAVNSLPPGEPQYFAPPPQTFHTKTSYGTNGSPSLTAYESIAQSSVNADAAIETHHHHHHHHIRDPAEIDHTVNDADRLGAMSFSSGSPRGITLQIGGGSRGLTGLLPIGALGVARGVLSSLLPRPSLGLNGKVFVGLEVGRGGGFTIGLG